jgi:DNA helicase-2/ATP-dependent DNA helicase PcrA
VDTLKLFGPPGTGKTHTLLNYMEHELKSGIRPDRLAYLTFTVKARLEATERATSKFNRVSADLPFFKTLHSIAYRELGMTKASLVAKTEDLGDFAELAGVEFNGKRQDDADIGLPQPAGSALGDRLLHFDHWRRHNFMTVDQALRIWPDDLDLYEARRFAQVYESWKETESLFDFTDLLERATTPLPVDVVIVDEAQDLSELQWSVLDRFAANAQRVYIAGDDDQAIFTWAGASPHAFLRREGTVRVLGQSYRVPKRVQEKAQAVIGPVKDRQAKAWKPRDADGTVNYAFEIGQHDVDPDVDTLILYRHHYLAKDVEEHLRSSGVPYTKSGGTGSGARWGPAIVYWERLRRGKAISHGEALEVYEALSVHAGFSRGGKVSLERAPLEEQYTLARLKESHGLVTEAPWYEAMTKIPDNERQYLRAIVKRFGGKGLVERPKTHLSTIHASKGGQAERVILLTQVSKKVRNSTENNPDPERRVFYVGMTRARSDLTLIGTENPVI